MSVAVPRIGERSSWDRVLDALDSRGLVTRVRGDSHADARCPAHDDGRASLTADYQAGDPGRVLLCCHAGCEFRDIVAALGLAEADIFDGPPPRDQPHAVRPRPVRAARRAPAPSSGRAKCRHRWREVETYPYLHAETGAIEMEVLRKECRSCGAKDFPVSFPDGQGGRVWNWPPVGHRPLFRAPEVRAAVRDGRTIFVVEGEKDVLAMEGAGQVATCNPGGAGKWLPEHTAALAGAVRVVVVADRDTVPPFAGYNHVALVAGELGAADPAVSVVEVVEAAEGKDAADHLAAGRAVGEFVPVDPYVRLAELEGAAEVAQLDAHRSGDGRGPKPPRDGDGQGDDGGRPDAPAAWVEVEGSPGWEYRPPSGSDAGAVAQWTGRGDARYLAEVVSWAPGVRARLVTAADDGSATGRHFELNIGDDTAVVSNADLRSGEAWDKFPDATGLGAKRVREVMHNVVTGHARKLPRTLAATRTGWHGSDGQRCYVWPDGRTFPDGREIRLIGMRPELAEAARPRGEATDAEIRQALADMVKHGRHAVLGLGCGARSFGQSIRPVPAGLAPWGEPNAGKTLLGWLGRSLAVTSKGATVPGWPPLPTKSFSATRTVLELAADKEADLPTLFEDLALPADAAAVEVRDANAKVEALLRSVGNADEIRGRATRDLTPAPANYVRSIPLITAERMPPVMMASLYRRAVVPRLYLGHIDTPWFAAHSPELLVPLRTIGARVVRLLYDMGADAAERLDKYTAAALAELSGAIGDAAWVREVPAMAGVVDASAAILGGLYMVADVVPGVDPAGLTAPAVAYLAEALAEQANVIADRGTHSGSLADAVGDVLTRALSGRRAHICNTDGVAAPLVPGLTPSEQGLRNIGGPGAPDYDGQGVPLYWLPDRGGIGVRSKSLHGLLTEYRDPRAAGLTPRSLPEALLRDGASIRNETQKGRSATHLVPSAGAWLVILRADVLTGDCEMISLSRSSDSNDKNDKNDNPAGQSVVNDLRAGNREKNDNPAGQRAAEPTEPAEATGAAEPVTRAVIDVRVSPASPADAGTRPGFVTAGDRYAAPAVVADTDSGYLARPDRVEAIALPSPLRDLADAAGWAVTLKLGVANPNPRGWDDDAVAVLFPELRARLGLPASPPERGSKAAGGHPALAPLRAAGWQVAELSSWMSTWRQGGRTVRLWVPEWDDPRECPMYEPEMPALDLAYRLGMFADLTGIGWRLTGGVTGVDLAAKFPRRRMRLEAADLPKPALMPVLEADFCWSRKAMDDEARLAWLHFYDENAMYLPAYGQAAVNCGGWRHVEAPAFDRKVPGYWLLGEVPEPGSWLLPDVLNPTGRDTGARRGGWFTTPGLARAAERGAEIQPREAWLPDSDNYGRFWEPWYKRLRDARAALTGEPDRDSAAVLAAVKSVWHKTHGQIAPVKRPASPTPRYHPDHRHMIIATGRANFDRRAADIGEAEGRWPLAILTDSLGYPSDDPDPRSARPAGLRCPGERRGEPGHGLGDGCLGGFKHAGTLPMADALPLLGTGGTRNVGALFDAAHDWQEAHHGA